MVMAYTLKLKGEPVLPGLALPEAFSCLERRLESVVPLCQARGPGSAEAQLVGVVAICQELQRLLKCAFIENGMLASRVEILTRHHMESMKKIEKRLVGMETENKITRKHMKRMRKQLSAYQVLQKKKSGAWWDVRVRSSDYDSFMTLSRAGGSPDLEFMLRVNQIMIDFVSDGETTELLLPPMGMEERQEVSKLASIYKLRCRYGKSVQSAPSTLLKARQACIPAPGEVDSILNNFTKTQRKAVSEEVVGEETKTEAATQDSAPSAKDNRLRPSPVTLPSSMLTPLSALPSPSIDITASFKSNNPSPPGSGLATPTEGPVRFLKQRDSVDVSGAPATLKTPLPPTQQSDTSTGGAGGTSGVSRSDALQSPHTDPKKGKDGAKDGVKDSSAALAQPVSENQPPTSSTTPFAPSPARPPSIAVSPASRKVAPIISSVGIIVSPMPAGTPRMSIAGGTRSPGGGMLMQQQIRGLSGHSMVVASPIKSGQLLGIQHISSDSFKRLVREKEEKEEGKKKGKEEEESAKEVKEGGGSGRTDTMGPPVKRLRVTRRSVAEEDRPSRDT